MSWAEGGTPLLVAAYFGRQEIISCLLEAGADADIADEVESFRVLLLLKFALYIYKTSLSFFESLFMTQIWQMEKYPWTDPIFSSL